MVSLIEQKHDDQRKPKSVPSVNSLVKDMSIKMKSSREEVLLDEIETLSPEIELPKQVTFDRSEIIITEPLPDTHKERDFDYLNFDHLTASDDKSDKITPEYMSQFNLKYENLLEALPGEELTYTPDITWEGAPRALLYAPSDHFSYQGRIEGKIQLRFWVDKSGEVIKAVPQKKLSPELEEKALRHILEYRFEPSDKYEVQEGSITINFMLD